MLTRLYFILNFHEFITHVLHVYCTDAISNFCILTTFKSQSFDFNQTIVMHWAASQQLH
jgi:hypothetical protein